MDNSLIKVLFVDDDEDDYILTRYWFSEFQVADCEQLISYYKLLVQLIGVRFGSVDC